jgi:hypothetical protein
MFRVPTLVGLVLSRERNPTEVGTLNTATQTPPSRPASLSRPLSATNRIADILSASVRSTLKLPHVPGQRLFALRAQADKMSAIRSHL